MKFEGKEIQDWQEQVWEAKEKIYRETKGKSFHEYLAYIRMGAEMFQAEGRAQEQTPSNESGTSQAT